jgi:hypothetical protein
MPWDAPEFAAAFASFGVPHPPGSPLVVAWGRVAVVLVGERLGVPLAASLASASASAMAGALLAWLLARRSIGAAAATTMALVASSGATWWAAASEPEAYALAMLLACGMMAAAQEAAIAQREHRHDAAWRWRALACYGAALAPMVHQLAWVCIPGAVALAWPTGRPAARQVARLALAGALGLSSGAMLWGRGLHDAPALMGNTATWGGTWDVLTRAAYPRVGWWPRQAGLAWQGLMPLQYLVAQYQVGWSWISGWPVAQAGVALLLVVPLGAAGAHWWWRRDRRMAWALAAMAAAGLFGVAWHLNLKLGPSLGWGIVPAAAPREVRERDSFFLVGLMAWGLLVGAGLVAAARHRTAIALAVAAAWLLAARVGMEARTRGTGQAYAATLDAALATLPPAAVVLAGTDWDAFGLWYAQVADGRRRDLTVVVLGLVDHPAYRARLERALPGILPVLGQPEAAVMSHVQHWAAARRRPMALGPWTQAAEAPKRTE